MNKKQKNKSVTSIAIKINSSAVRSLFFRFLLLDILLIITITGYWCVDKEKEFYGNLTIEAQRSFNFYPIEEAKYTVEWADGKTMEVNASEVLHDVKKIVFPMLVLQGIFILSQIVFGTAATRRRLKPLDEIAKTAERLSNINFDEEKFQGLEEAISKISPTAADERINIGDSELKGLEDAINKLLDRMRESYRQQARFVSDASHELRTPISVIQGYANMLDRWGKDDESVLEESIIAIKSESENMKNLVEQLLFLARGINGKTKLFLEEFSLSTMMEEVLNESKMIDKEHEYVYKSQENIMVYGDCGLLKQTARILIQNAVKYTESGDTIVLKTGINDKGESWFSVQDNGIGIDNDDIPHLFERFFRADTARVRKNGGTGLGLSIAKWIVDNHKGYFSVLSRKGIGTRFTVYIPKKENNDIN